jgi:membrane fusion protein, heavy metal efflux system
MSLNLIKNKQPIAIILVIVIGIILTAIILSDDKQDVAEDGHGHEHNETEMTTHEDESRQDGHMHPPTQTQEFKKGPHGGKLFTQGDYSIEVTIYERNAPPEFRIYTYKNGEELAPNLSNIQVQLERLGRSPQQISFSPEKDYLKGKAIVKEPHSFKVNIEAKHDDKDYQFSYEQVEARVTITEEQLKHNSIEVLTAGPARIKSALNLQGEIKLNADKTVLIVPLVGGMIKSVNVNAGDKVKKGQVLASVSSQLVADIRSELLSAQKKVRLARATYTREKQLWEEQISAKQDYLQAQEHLQEAEINVERLRQKLGALGTKSNNKSLTHYDIRSPIDGIVTEKQVSQGQVVGEVDSIFEISDLSTVWVEVVIYAKDIRTVKAGQKVTVKSNAIDAQAIGTIAYVSSLVGNKSRTATARVVLNNADRTWPPGLPVNVELIANEVDVPLAISVEGLQSFNDWSVVFGRYGESFEARPIKVGRRDDRYIEVLEGLNVGEKYAAGNSFIIKADIGKAGASHDH